MVTVVVPVEAVVVGNRRRPLSDERVAALQASIAAVGLLQPIVVTDTYGLVAGRHRLEAARRLGWATIPARVAPLDDLRTELAEIDENLIRHELTVLEQAEHLARRDEILTALGERAHVGWNGNRYVEGPHLGSATVAPPKTTDDLAAEIGVSKRSAQERMQIARALDPDVKTAVSGTPLADRTRDLLDLARMAPEEQRAVVAVEGVKEGRTAVKAARRQVARAKGSPERAAGTAAGTVLYHGDALRVIPTLADGSVALVVADPPYNTTQYDWDRIGSDEEYLTFMASWLRVLRPKLAAGYHLFLFCDPDYQAAIEMLLKREGYPLKSRLIWEYRNLVKGRNASDKFVENWQMCFHCGTHALRFPDAWDDRRFMVQNHARPQSNFTEGSYHPTPKPVSLLRILVEFGSAPGDLVLDPFAGGGPVGQACCEVGGRQCVLIEKESHHCRAIEARLGVMVHAL